MASFPSNPTVSDKYLQGTTEYVYNSIGCWDVNGTTGFDVVADYAKKVGDSTQTFRVADAVNADEAVALGQVKEKINYDLTVLVADTGGDFTNINDAIRHLSETYTPTYIKGGFNAQIQIADGYVIKEQMIFKGVDLSWISLTSLNVNYEVLVDRAFLTIAVGSEYGQTRYPVYSATHGAKAPILDNIIFDCQVVLGSGTASDGKAGLFSVGSGSVIHGVNNCGAIQCSGIGVYAHSGGTISAYTMTASSNRGYGVYARSGTISAYTMTASSNSNVGVYALTGTISAYTMTASSNSSVGVYALTGTISAYTMTASSNSGYGVYARSGTISAYTMTASNTASSSTYLVRVLGGGMIKSYTGVWTNNGSGPKCNVTAGTISSNGYVNRLG